MQYFIQNMQNTHKIYATILILRFFATTLSAQQTQQKRIIIPNIQTLSLRCYIWKTIKQKPQILIQILKIVQKIANARVVLHFFGKDCSGVTLDRLR